MIVYGAGCAALEASGMLGVHDAAQVLSPLSKRGCRFYCTFTAVTTTLE